MTRTPRSLYAHTFTCARTRRHASDPHRRAPRFRLDSLESRDMQGNVVSGLLLGLAGATMLEPWQAMAAAVGDVALLAPVNSPAPTTSSGAPESVERSEPIVAPPVRAAEPAAVVTPPAAVEPALVSPGDGAVSTTIDPGDLSIADPPSISPAPVPPASTDSSGSASGGSADPAASALSGQSVAGGAEVIGSVKGGDATGLSIPDPSGTSAGPAARSVGTAGASTPSSAPLTPGSGRPAETFVTPPNDAPKLEGPAKSAGPAVAVATTTNPIFAVGTDAGVANQVKVYDAQTLALKFTLSPYPTSFTGGVRVGVADVTGDGTADIVTGTGPGGGNKVRVYNGSTGKALNGTLGNFTAFTAAEANGVFVAAGDVTGDGKADIVVGTDGNAAPQVKVFSGVNGALVRTLSLGNLNIAGGARVAAGDVNGDGKADVIVAGGPGGVARVAAFDGGNGKPLYNFFPFEAGYNGGLNVTAGDWTGDGYADIVVGQASDAARVKVFSGNDTSSIRNLDAFDAGAVGARVGVVDADRDGKLDLLAGRAPGGGEVRGYAAAGGSQLVSLQPFGAGYTGGLFVAGDARPVAQDGGVGIQSTTTVAVQPGSNGVEGGSASFVVTRSGGDTSQSLTINCQWGGTAQSGSDYGGAPGSITFDPFVTSVNIPFDLNGVNGQFQDTLMEGPETIAVTLSYPNNPPPPIPPLVAFNPAQAAVTIRDDDGNLSTPPTNSACGAPGTAPQSAGLGLAAPAKSGDGVRLADGVVAVGGTDLESDGFGQPAGVTRQWTNAVGADDDASDGNGTVTAQLPYLRTNDVSRIVVVTGGADNEYFDLVGSNYVPRHMSEDALIEQTAQKTFQYWTSAGAVIEFYNYDTTWPTGWRGRAKKLTDPDGNVTQVSYDANGRPTTIWRDSTVGGVTTTERFTYAYLTAPDPNAGKASRVTLERQVGTSSSVTIRTVDYTYHDGTTANGNLGDVKTAVVKDNATPTPNVLSSKYYRYTTPTVGTGFVGSIRYVVTGSSYDRLATWAAANGTTVDGATDAQIAPFADDYFEYDGIGRVSKHTQQGTGCTACAGGLGTTTYAYTTSTFANDYNLWRTKTVETRADGNTLTVYTNFVGQAILEVYKDTTTSQEWATYHQYDTAGREILVAMPSAVSGYDATKPDLLNNQNGNYQYLRDGQGLIETASYYGNNPNPAAGPTTAGGVTGYLYQTFVKRGESGTAVLQSTTDYFSQTANGITVYPVANQTRYRNTNGTGGQTTSFAYTYFTGTIQPQQITATLPAVTTGQNGSGTPDSYVTVQDDRGRVIWTKDQAGFLTYTEYDDVTGGVTKVIRDVDTTQTGTFANLPSGWTTPSGGGLHRTTTYEVDALGRPTKGTDPNGNVTYVVYKDDVHEVRVYPGWDSTNNVPTGPTQVYRDDRAHGYTETLTMSAAPSHPGGRPDGQEAVSGIQSLSRDVLNDAGQVVYQDVYFDLTGVTYSQTSVTLGTAGTNYNRTQLSYGKFGQLERTLTPGGTIYRTVFDGQVRPLSTWVGTDDTPTSGFWSPTNTAGTDMKQLTATEYDSGGVGDGLVTKDTEIPGGGAANRDTAYSYDWRDRPVATKAGVEGTESTALNRPITYTEYDNLDQAIVNESYDGDGLSITTDANSDGVPDRPTSGALRAKSTIDFDELGRVYQAKTFSVDPSSGSVSTNALVSKQWFNSRGLVMKTSSPGGTVSKTEFDGLGRTTKSYLTDGGGDSAYGDADDVAGDNVLSQSEATYDANGNVLLTTTRERFHDETGTGTLGTPTTGVKARVSYAASYFDKANRLTDSVDVGTNGGSSYTRPSAPDGRDDSHLRISYGYNLAGQVETVTDPKALVNKTYFDLAGRTTKTIENYLDGVVSDVDDKTVEYTYDADGHQKTLKAYLTSTTSETTEWVYGITSPIVSNDVLKEMRYPNPTAEGSSSTEKDSYTYNQLGQVLTKTDRNNNVHTYSYDILGRQTADSVATGTGVDGAVKRIETAYDGQGNISLVTSYDAATGGNVVNQVQREFNGLGQMTKEYQATSGTVNTGTTPNVQYAYSFAPSGSTNHSRLTSVTYPNGRVITYNYASGLSDNISRLSAITDGATTLESYDYLGAGTVVRRAHPQPGVDLTYVKLSGESDGSAGDQYVGLDRFGRVVDQRWTDNAAPPVAKDRWQYGYDQDSNRLYKENLVDSTRSELYTYDGLNQLSTFARGTLNGTKDGIITGTASRTQAWDFDALGNFDSQTTGSTAQTRTHNRQNEITSVQNATTPTYDADGNLTKDETGRTFTYDAWNRLVEVRDSGTNLLATYRYDGTGRRVRETRGSTTIDLYYSSAWQVLEERVGTAVQSSYVWSPVYVDDLVARDRDADGNPANGLEERMYAVQDANFNVTALLGLVSGSWTVVERYAYDPFGTFAVMDGSWGPQSGSSYAWKYLHQGGRWDTDAGVYSFRNRELSPTLGRWLQMDPIGFAGGDQNVYRYERNKPLRAADPLGLAEPYQIPITTQDLASDPALYLNSIYGPGGLVSYRPVIFRYNLTHLGVMAYDAADDAGKTIYNYVKHGVVKPTYRTGQFLYDVPQAAYDSTYQPTNPYFAAFLNHNMGYGEAWALIALDASVPATLGYPVITKLPGLPNAVLNTIRKRAMQVPWQYDASLLCEGMTDKAGNIFIRSDLVGEELETTVAHEAVHRWLSARNGPVWRQDLGIRGYKQSQLLQYLEEAAAETVGTGSFRQGLTFPFNGNYPLNPWRVGLEGAGYATFVGGSSYGAYYLGDKYFSEN